MSFFHEGGELLDLGAGSSSRVLCNNCVYTSTRINILFNIVNTATAE